MKKLGFILNKNIIHTNLKLYRIKNNLTQGQLAAKMQTMNINIDQQMISKIERNNRIVTDYELACLCRSLNVNIDDMIKNVELEDDNQ